MNVSQASKIWLEYHRAHSKHNTVRTYEFTITKFNQTFAYIDLNEVSTDDILDFMLKPRGENPRQNGFVIEKETVDEIIFRTDNIRNRLMLELMARGGMRVGEVLKLTPADILDQKLILNDTKSGKEQELIFISQKVADRLKEYVRVKKIVPTQMIFPICYGAARAMVRKAGKMVGIRLRPHDLRRHAATFASRSNVPLEIISKIILRHSSLQSTEIYLGKVSDNEAIRWIENLYS